MSNTKPSISVVVPVYNSELTLDELVARLEVVLAEAASEYEIILINDGSIDSSWQRIQRLASSRPNVNGISLMKNYGQHNALLAGIRAARFEIAITLDDDLQNPPEQIPKLLAQLQRGYSVVYGTPDAGQYQAARGFSTKFSKLIIRYVLGFKAIGEVSSFRAIRTDLRQSFAAYQGAFVSLDILLTWGTSSFSSIPVRHEKRLLGRSNYNFWKLLRFTADMITSFSERPLQVASMLGFTAMALGVVVFVYVMVNYFLAGHKVPGFTFLASIVAILSGCQLLVLGIIGAYLGRIHFRVLDKPTYVITEIAGSGGE
jgi:undecaprenyl-phosphate 4-deoxy-4-formamido-L-arabinose transferase